MQTETIDFANGSRYRTTQRLPEGMGPADDVPGRVAKARGVPLPDPGGLFCPRPALFLDPEARMGILERLRFEWRYWRGDTPWDTNVTPPEVLEFLAAARPGRALDLGCGTGTNAIALARRGWRVTAVDFSVKAVRTAHRKARAAGVEVEFRCADVTRLEGLGGPFDYALDIGCLLGLRPEERLRYAETVARLLRPGGDYMLYAWFPRRVGRRIRGIAPEEVEALLGRHFERTRLEVGKERGRPSAWYWYRRRKPSAAGGRHP